MMTEDYISFEIAKLLKKLGFDEECVGAYSETNNTITKFEPNVKNSEVGPLIYSTPTLQMAMKWLREVPKIFIEIKMSKNTFLWGYRVTISNGRTTCFHTNIFNKYEEACEAAIKYCLENLF